MLNRIDPWVAQQFDDIERRAKDRLLDARKALRARCAAIDEDKPHLTEAEYAARLAAALEEHLDAADAVFVWASKELERLMPPLPPLPPDPRRVLH